MNSTENKKTNNGKNSTGSGKIMDFVAKILCLVIAFFLWFYAMSTDVITLEKEFTLPIEFENESYLADETGWAVLDGRGATTTIIVKGKRNVINNMTPDDVHAYVDVSGVESEGVHELDVKISLPGGCEVVHRSDESISVLIDKKLSTSVAVKPEMIDTPIPEGFDVEFSAIEKIMITGPASEVRRVENAVAEFSLGELTETVSTVVGLKLVGKDNKPIDDDYITMHTKNVNVTVKVSAEKEVDLTYDFKYGYFNKNNVDITVTPKRIKIKGETSVLKNINSIKLVTLDEKNCKEGAQSYQIKLPAGVSVVDDQNVAWVDVKHTTTSTKSLNVSNITYINAGGLEVEPLVENLNITVRAPITVLPQISADDINVTVNLQGYNPGDGEVRLPAIISISNEFEDVYEIDEYNVSVRIK